MNFKIDYLRIDLVGVDLMRIDLVGAPGFALVIHLCAPDQRYTIPQEDV